MYIDQDVLLEREVEEAESNDALAWGLLAAGGGAGILAYLARRRRGGGNGTPNARPRPQYPGDGGGGGGMLDRRPPALPPGSGGGLGLMLEQSPATARAVVLGDDLNSFANQRAQAARLIQDDGSDYYLR